jgi:hypothetical protein
LRRERRLSTWRQSGFVNIWPLLTQHDQWAYHDAKEAFGLAEMKETSAVRRARRIGLAAKTHFAVRLDVKVDRACNAARYCRLHPALP